MRYIYLFLILLLTLPSVAQNDLLGEWYLHYIEVDGEQIYSTIPNSFNNIIFSDDNFNGTVCNNGYGGGYSMIDDSTIQVTGFVYFTGFCNYLNESILFLFPYFSIFDTPVENNIFNYIISGTGNYQTLQLTNSENNAAFYGRMPLPENNLPGIWYLHSTTINDVEEMNTYNPNFYIQFTINAGSFMSLDFMGTGVCNDYFGEYHIEGTDAIRIIGFNRTLAMCSTYEEAYFTFYGETMTGTISRYYAISGSGDNETLVISDDNGDYVTYGRQTLSVEDNTFNRINVQLKENPVNMYLALDINEVVGNRIHYQIFSVDGKKIVEGQLSEKHSIDVNYFNAGIYFLKMSFEDYDSQIIKFIKH